MINENRINVTAHAGCMETKMDSIEAIEAGIKHGADIIEIDLNIDENKNLILSHDKPQIGTRYPSFEGVLEIIKKHKEVLLNIDIKDARVLGKLNRTILDYDVKDKVFFTGLNRQSIIENEEMLREIDYFINLEFSDVNITQLNNKEYLIQLISELESLNVIGININYKLATPEIISACKERRMLSSVWTVDDVEEMKRIINLDVSSITTKRVDVLKKLISKMTNDR